jgi:hypothetical protein
MRLFDIIPSINSSVTPDRCKLHLACSNGIEGIVRLSRHGNWGPNKIATVITRCLLMV